MTLLSSVLLEDPHYQQSSHDRLDSHVSIGVISLHNFRKIQHVHNFHVIKQIFRPLQWINSTGDIGSLGSSTLRLLHIELSNFLNVREAAPGALRHSLLKISLKPSVNDSAERFILFESTILSDMYAEREWLCTFVISNKEF